MAETIRTSDYLVEGKVYSRAKLREQFAITAASVNNGIFQPFGHKSVWLFVTAKKTSDRTQYVDSFDGTLLRMQGQILGRTDRLLVEHLHLGLELLLFYRKTRDEFSQGGFRYEGQFQYVSHHGNGPASFLLHRIGKVGPYKHGDSTTWMLAVDAIEALGGRASSKDVLAHITRNQLNYNRKNVNADLNMLAVNSPSRRGYSQNSRPRRSDTGSPFDLLFKDGQGAGAIYERYEVEKHGVWELYFPSEKSAEGKIAVRCVHRGLLDQALAKAELAPYDVFDPLSIEDARERVAGAITQRRGQPLFRRKLLAAYDGRCAITGCALPEILEAAHIHPYKGVHTNRVNNGLLLRADVHTLFDLGLIRIDPATWQVRLSIKLVKSDYAALEGKTLSLPASPQQRPSSQALAWHFQQSKT